MGNLNMEARQIHYRHDDTMTVDNKLLNLEGRVATLEDGEPAEVSKVDIAPVFSAESAYSAGDYVYHEGHLYKFTADHAAGTWSDLDTESAVVTADLTDQAGDIDQLMSGLINVNTALDVPAGTGKNLAFKKISNATINESGVIESNNGYNLFVAKVSNGETYTATKGSDYRVYAFYSTEPVVGSTSYDGSRVVEENDPDHPNTFTVIAPISGYIAFRSVVAYTDGQLEKGSTATPYTPYIPSVETRLESVEKGNVSHEILKSSTDVWSGDTLTFTVAPENGRMWRLVAGVSYSLGSKFVEAYIVIRTGEGGVFIYNAHGTVTATYDYTTGVLTVTLPESSHWIYRMELAAAYYD